ncbi:MAG: DmsE family decaheme c-type cytochrome [Gammaproteobacteria bacterium]|nr:DmsE family decaheme c-type cytochrome [Gammaproteobacteria bacterium]
MNTKHSFFAALLLFSGLVLSHSIMAEEPAADAAVNDNSVAPAVTVSTPESVAVDQAVEAVTSASPPWTPPVIKNAGYTEHGADTCIKCHDEEEEYPVFDIFKTKHGQQGDKRSPFASLQCEACHGPGAEAKEFMEEEFAQGGHIGKVPPGKKRPPILNFGSKSDESVEKQNNMCLACHKGNTHIGWKNSAHENGSIACANCHTVHAAHDPVMVKATQSDVCYKCHKKERADFLKPSSHPVRTGLMTCTECHKPHGTSGADKVLAKPTVNQTCFTCHADKRGPFLWEHAPVSEDCTLCHNPHGSIHGSLLKKDPPLLCQQCHAPGGHPAVALTGSSLIGGGNPASSAFLLSGGCTNCHSQVHGSNHPSGVRQMR